MMLLPLPLLPRRLLRRSRDQDHGNEGEGEQGCLQKVLEGLREALGCPEFACRLLFFFSWVVIVSDAVFGFSWSIF